MFKNFFKGGNNDFYLEMEEESKDTPSQPAQTPTASNGAKSATAVAPTPESKPVEKEAQTAAEVAKTETATPDSGETRKKTFRKSKVAKKETAPASAPTSTPAPTPPAVSPKDLTEDKTFAPKYLIPTSTNGRRRPGPNMNSFLEMASQVKINPSKNTIKPKTIASSKAPTPVKTDTPEKSAKSVKSAKSAKSETK